MAEEEQAEERLTEMEILFEGEKMEIWRECKLFLQEERWRFWEEWVSFCNWQEEEAEEEGGGGGGGGGGYLRRSL
jgi:hypothetical protein